MSKHYKYGGSTAGRTIQCPGWANYSKQFPERKAGKPADVGTMLHTCCETLENEELEYDELLERGVEYNGQALTQELLDTKVIPAMEGLDGFCEYGGFETVITEQLIEYNEIIGGTPDILAQAPGVIGGLDFKFGDGDMVYADDNPQLFFCIWIAVADGLFGEVPNDTKVIFAIDQPSDRRDETLDMWDTDMSAVQEFGLKFLAAVDKGENSEVGEHLNPGKYCKYCSADGVCKAQEAKRTTALKILGNLTTQNAKGKLVVKENYDPMDLTTALKLANELESGIKAVRAFAINHIEAGGGVEGWKLVQKKANRKWRDPKQVAKYLKRKLTANVAMVSVPISPKKAEDAGKRLDIELRLDKHITEGVSSGVNLVPESHKGEAVISQKAISETLKQLENKEEN